MNRISKFLIFSAGIILFSTPPTALAQASFNGLGFFPDGNNDFSRAWGVSGDGRTVVGQSNYQFSDNQAFRWIVGEDSLTGLDFLEGGDESEAWDISGDGQVIVGWSRSSQGDEPVRWLTNPDTVISLGNLTGTDPDGEAWAASTDGSVIVGNAENADGNTQAFRWTANPDTLIGLDELPGAVFSSAYGVSGDGSIVSGDIQHPDSLQGFRWTEADGMLGLGGLGGTNFTLSQALGISSDGSTVIGYASAPQCNESFSWTEAGGMIGLGCDNNPARGVSADGSVIVGSSLGRASIWTAAEGTRVIQDVLEDDYGIDLGGWLLQMATDVSDDGTVIVGYGLNPDFNTEAWRAVVPLTTDISEDGGHGLPSDFELLQNYPNPFNPTTTISYQLPITSHVTLKVYNVLGQEIATLVNGKQEAGYRRTEWDAGAAASGTYLYKIEARSLNRNQFFRSTKKMFLVR